MTRRRSPIKTTADPIPLAEAEPPLPTYRLPVVAAAFVAGVFCTTRPVREVLCGVVRAAAFLGKPVLVVGGILKLREWAGTPSVSSSADKSQPTHPDHEKSIS